MNEKHDFIQEKLNNIRSGKKSPDSIKKKKLSRIILLVDIIIVIIILIIFNKNTPEPQYYSTGILYKNFNYRASITQERESANYIFSLTIRSNSKKTRSQIYKNSIAVLTIQNNKNVILKKKIGKDIPMIKLMPEEIKTFIANIDHFILKKYILDNPETIIFEKSGPFSKKKYVPIDAIITLNTKESISTNLKIKYEVK